jgi:hypothetical protein
VREERTYSEEYEDETYTTDSKVGEGSKMINKTKMFLGIGGGVLAVLIVVVRDVKNASLKV